MNRFFLMALSAALFFSCSKENGGTMQNEGDSAYLALNFPNTPTRANTGVVGSEQESKMTSATVLLFDDLNMCLGCVVYSAFTTNPATEVKMVSSKTKRVFVSINNYATGWDLSDAAVTGKSWDAINSYAAVNPTNIATDNAFMMTNAGDNTKGALVDVVLYETEADAKSNPNTIYVDRLVSKIQVDLYNMSVPNATFSFMGWDLNTVNKTARLYSDRITYANASVSDRAAIYRRDKNYLKSELKADLSDYVWLTNGTNGTDMSPVDKTAITPIYCPENTMDADAQLWGHTTKIVIKAKYTPSVDAVGAALTAGVSYFSWNSNNYSVANMTSEYKKADKASLKTDLITFLKAADDTFAALSETDQKVEANIDAAIGRLDAYSGIKAKYNAVRYYHLSVCYYDALIPHDNGVTTLMALGRYGVVRNNSYLIHVSAVKAPGTPWIPDPTDPADPTKPTDPDDEMPANLSVNVTVNPWTYWSHDVELGK